MRLVNLEILYLNGNQIGEECCGNLFNQAGFKRLTELHLQNNTIERLFNEEGVA